MSLAPLDSALAPGADPRAHARRLARVRKAGLVDDRATADALRPVIRASWRRVRGSGLDPAGPGEVALLGVAELQRRRAASGLEQVLPVLRARLLPAAEAAGQLMVVVDAAGRVLWREGGAGVRRQADRLGFVEGSAWDEPTVGTNAIGTSLVTGRPLQVYAGEHWSDGHQPWTCAAAPLHDPATGALLGAVDLSGPAHTVHASTVALVAAVARLAELEVRAAHDRGLDGLRALAAPVLARLPGRALVVALTGATAATSGLSAPDRLVLPAGLRGGPVRLAGLGACTVTPLPGGWLVQLDDGPEAPCGLAVDLRAAPARVRVDGAAGSWTHVLGRRHAEILLALLDAPAGRTAAELADDLFGDASRTVTVRAEVSRLRRTLGPLLEHRPYRLGPQVEVRLDLPADPEDLLPGSTAPVVLRRRRA